MGVLPIINPYDPGVSSDMSKAWKKVAKEAYASFLVACSGTTTCDSGTCYTNAGESWGRICCFFFCVVYDFKNPDVFALVYEIYCR